MQISADQIKTILGSKPQDGTTPKKRIKLSNAPNDDMDEDEAKDLVNKSGIHSYLPKSINDAIDNTGRVTPDQGDVIKQLRNAKAKSNGSQAAAKQAAQLAKNQ